MYTTPTTASSYEKPKRHKRRVGWWTGDDCHGPDRHYTGRPTSPVHCPLPIPAVTYQEIVEPPLHLRLQGHGLLLLERQARGGGTGGVPAAAARLAAGTALLLIPHGRLRRTHERRNTYRLVGVRDRRWSSKSD